MSTESQRDGDSNGSNGSNGSGDRIIVPRASIVYDIDGETQYDEGRILAQLLLDGVCAVNDGRIQRGERASDQEYVYAFVCCNDVFAWAYADAEPVTTDDLPALYEAHMADSVWGAAKWAIRHRGEMPQAAVMEAMKRAGAWDIDESTLKPNGEDAETQAIFARAAAIRNSQAAHRDGQAPTETSAETEEA